MDGVLLCGSGIIPPDDAEEISTSGIGRLFGPGTDTREIVKYLSEELARRRGS